MFEGPAQKLKRKLKALGKYRIDLTYRDKKIYKVTRGVHIGSIKIKLQSKAEHWKTDDPDAMKCC